MNNIQISILENLADDIYEDNKGADRSFSDDGAIHIVRSGRRFVISLGQEVSRFVWSADARRIGRALRIPNEEVNEWITTEFGN